MLSPGKDHELVPREPRANAKFRLDILERAKGDKQFQRGLIEICRLDILFFINTFVIQFNPKKKGFERVTPFVTWDFQEAALLDTPETTGSKGILWYYEHDKSCVIEKSREMGASWLLLILQLWLCLFEEWFKGLNVSRNADAVDKKSSDSLFWKIRFMNRYLPRWMTGPIITQEMHIEYTKTNSSTTGEASTEDVGVGGRASLVNIDEFPKIKKAIEVRNRTAGTSDCRFFTGTHLGSDTEFYRLTVNPEIGKIVMHWTQHPDKKKGMYRVGKHNKVEILDKGYVFPLDYRFVLDGTPNGGVLPGIRSPWYDQKCIDIGSARGAAMELDIDPKGSSAQFFDAQMLRELIDKTVPPYWEGDLDYDRDLGIPHKLVARPGGPIKLWLMPDVDGKVPHGRYAAGTDVAMGHGATSSCLSIGDADLGEKVLEYANPFIDPKDYAVFCVALCWLFRDDGGQGALLGWEIPGPGVTMGRKVLSLGYRNVHHRSANWTTLEAEMPGWVNTPSNLKDLLTEYNSAIRKGEFVNRSESAMKECRSFKVNPAGMVEHMNMKSPDDPTGARTNHSDQVIADAIMNMLVKKLGQSERAKKEESAPVGSMQWRRDMREQRLKAERAWA